MGFTPSTAQLIGTVAVAAALVAGAFLMPRRELVPDRRVPPVWATGLFGAVAWGWHEATAPSWLGVGIGAVLLGGLLVAVAWWSRSRAWGQRHVLALCAAVLAVQAIMAFGVEPLGDPDPVARYAVNSALAAGVIVLMVLAFRRSRRAPMVRSPDPLANGGS